MTSPQFRETALANLRKISSHLNFSSDRTGRRYTSIAGLLQRPLNIFLLFDLFDFGAQFVRHSYRILATILICCRETTFDGCDWIKGTLHAIDCFSVERIMTKPIKDKFAIAAALQEIGTLLELKGGENISRLARTSPARDPLPS